MLRNLPSATFIKCFLVNHASLAPKSKLLEAFALYKDYVLTIYPQRQGVDQFAHIQVLKREKYVFNSQVLSTKIQYYAESSPYVPWPESS